MSDEKERAISFMKRMIAFGEEEGEEHYKLAINALRRSQDHSAIQAKCNELATQYRGVHTTMLAIRDQRDKYSAEVADLREQLAAAQSSEVCTVAHSDEVMEFCPYCKIERLRGDLSETRIALANAECREGVAKARVARWAVLLMECPTYMAVHLSPVGERAAARLCEKIERELDDAGYVRAADSAYEVPCRHEWYNGACVHCLRWSPHGAADSAGEVQKCSDL